MRPVRSEGLRVGAVDVFASQAVKNKAAAIKFIFNFRKVKLPTSV